MSELHLFTIDDVDTVVAADDADAWAVWLEHNGGTRSDYPDSECEQLPDDKPFTIVDVDEPDQPSETLTCAEWAANGGGRRFLGSTEY